MYNVNKILPESPTVCLSVCHTPVEMVNYVIKHFSATGSRQFFFAPGKIAKFMLDHSKIGREI